MPDTGNSANQILAGQVERVTFHNDRNGFCVLRVKARGHRELVTVTGHSPNVSAGEWITATGDWINDRNHGLQFKAEFLRTSSPSTVEGIEKYLGSGMIPGIGPVYAKRLIKHFGTDVFEIIEASPERLREVNGIGPIRAARITDGWADQKVIREVMVFLHQHGVGTSRAVRIFRTYGVSSVQVMTENPYRLARDIFGMGFRTADLIAERLGIEKTASIRVRAGIAFALNEAVGNGHCGLPRTELVTLAERLLEVPGDLVEDAIQVELAERTVTSDRIRDTECLFLTKLHAAERGISEQFARIADGSAAWSRIDAERALPWVERGTGMQLADRQKDAVRLALSSKILVITGGPGVGKTTIVNSILRILEERSVDILLTAPTGRAAKRMMETTGREAKTIHRLLEFDPISFGFRRNAENPLNCDLLVIDECSMVDVSLMNSLLKAIPDHAALLIVGDIDQLPSVGPGQVLADIIESGTVPVIALREVFRQASRSGIITSAHRINRGLLPDLSTPVGDSDFYFVPADGPEQAVSRIIELVRNRIPRRFGLDPVRDIQVLCPMSRGGIGARSLNIELQACLNPDADGKIERFGWTFATGDKVMQIQNDYDRDIYNGDIGLVEKVDADEGEITVRFDCRPVTLPFNELDTLVPAYAITVHKSQGSEFPAVIIPIMTQHYMMLQRNLFYTAVTRGRKLVVLVGQKKAVAIATGNVSGRQRWSKLKEWLADRDKDALPA